MRMGTRFLFCRGGTRGWGQRLARAFGLWPFLLVDADEARQAILETSAPMCKRTEITPQSVRAYIFLIFVLAGEMRDGYTPRVMGLCPSP